MPGTVLGTGNTEAALSLFPAGSLSSGGDTASTYTNGEYRMYNI